MPRAIEMRTHARPFRRRFTARVDAPGIRWSEFALLGLLALLWGSSYPLIKVAVTEIPPLTLIAVRVMLAAALLGIVMRLQGLRLPGNVSTWGRLGLQAVFNSIGAWTVLAWGQQYIDSATAAVLNSTAPIAVFVLTATLTRHESTSPVRLAGALLGVLGVSLIVGTGGQTAGSGQLAGQLAALLGALLYAGAAIHGRRFAGMPAATTATGTMLWASACLVPAALWIDRPWTLAPSAEALGATVALGTLCTGAALLLYFRLLKTLGSMAVASQAYLRAGVGALLGVLVLGEHLSPAVLAGIALTVAGVVAINAPTRSPS